MTWIRTMPSPGAASSLLSFLAAVAIGCSAESAGKPASGGSESGGSSSVVAGGGGAGIPSGGVGAGTGGVNAGGSVSTGGSVSAGGVATGGSVSSGGATAGGMSTGGAAGGGPVVPECGNPPEWASGTSYTTGQIVHYSNYCQPEISGYYIAVDDNPGYDPVESNFFWDPYECTGGIQDGVAESSTTPGCALDTYLPEKSLSFRKIFCAPTANQVIHPVFADAYNDLCKALAVGSLSSFGKGGTDEQNKREIAAFFANVAVETAYLTASAEGRVYGQSDFRGRGCLQLTGQSNYQLVASGLGNQTIVNTPSIVESDPQMAWQTGLWFWLNYSGSNLGTCRQAIHAGNFGLTLRIIKGNCAGFSGERMPPYEKACEMMGIQPTGASCP